MRRIGQATLVIGTSLALAACGGSAAEPGTGGSSTQASSGTSSMQAGAGGSSTESGTGGTAGACSLTANTTETATVSPSGCHLLTRDTSSCAAARMAQGLSGLWLKFSCRVSLSESTEGGAQVVMAASDGQPDYESEYFPMTNACYVDEPGSTHNPNEIAVQTYVVQFPLAPDTATQKMTGAVVGLAVNGVPVFGNFAAPGDDIYVEAKSFDRCGGHPQMTGAYHYHGEPYAISYEDDAFIGVMRDGYPIYGRQDPGGATPVLDAAGGHTGVTVDSPTTPVYHYHLNQQTSTTAGSAGEMQWFLTTGTYHGAPGGCGSCN